MSWLLDRIEDPLGNYVELTYQEDGGMGRIAKIAYGANRVTGQSHVYELLFSYTTNRPDQHKKYIGGSYVETKYLMSKIEINRIGQETLYGYVPYYVVDMNQTDFYPRLEYLWHFYGDSESDIINPTILEWGEFEKNGFVSYEHDDGWQNEILTDNFFMDINGDGLSDKVAVKYQWYEHEDDKAKEPVSWNFRLRLQNNTFSNPVSLGTPPASFFSHLISGDFNGDGLSDFAYIRFNHENQHITIVDRIAISKGNGFDIHVLPNGGIQSDNYPFFNLGDFNGDGKSELLLAKRKNPNNDNSSELLLAKSKSPNNDQDYKVFIY
jgi:hypothetical protein